MPALRSYLVLGAKHIVSLLRRTPWVVAVLTYRYDIIRLPVREDILNTCFSLVSSKRITSQNINTFLRRANQPSALPTYNIHLCYLRPSGLLPLLHRRIPARKISQRCVSQAQALSFSRYQLFQPENSRIHACRHSDRLSFIHLN